MPLIHASGRLVDDAAQVLLEDLRVSGNRPTCPGCPFTSCVTTTRPLTDVLVEDLRVSESAARQVKRQMVDIGRLVVTPVVDDETRTVLCVEVAVSTV